VYEPAPHRCEFVRTIGGVDYVNDSKATNLDAAGKALQAQTKPVVLIAGGKDKGFDFQPLRDLVKEKAHTAILLGEMANRIADDWREATRCEIARSLADAVERARALLIVLLLHIVAVAGIIAFNAIKSRQGGMPVISSSHIAKSSTNHEEAKTMQPSSAKTGKKSKTNDPVPEGAKVYTVAKGDNPVNIAKKFKV